VRLLSDPEATLIRLRHGDEGHWAGQIAASVTCIVDTSGKVKLAMLATVQPTGRVRWRWLRMPARSLPAEKRRQCIREKCNRQILTSNYLHRLSTG